MAPKNDPESTLLELASYCMECHRLMGEAVELFGQGKVRTAREWIRRGRREIRAAQDLIEFVIDMREDERKRGG